MKKRAAGLRRYRAVHTTDAPSLSKQQAFIVLGLTVFSLSLFLTLAGDPTLTGAAVQLQSSQEVPVSGVEKGSLCNSKRPTPLVGGSVQIYNLLGKNLAKGTTSTVLDPTLCQETSNFVLMKKCAPPATTEAGIRAKTYCGDTGGCRYAKSTQGTDKGNVYCAYFIPKKG
jgi:hypothetical protein